MLRPRSHDVRSHCVTGEDYKQFVVSELHIDLLWEVYTLLLRKTLDSREGAVFTQSAL